MRQGVGGAALEPDAGRVPTDAVAEGAVRLLAAADHFESARLVKGQAFLVGFGDKRAAPGAAEGILQQGAADPTPAVVFRDGDDPDLVRHPVTFQRVGSNELSMKKTGEDAVLSTRTGIINGGLGGFCGACARGLGKDRGSFGVTFGGPRSSLEAALRIDEDHPGLVLR
jgi:hypothetical protein